MAAASRWCGASVVLMLLALIVVVADAQVAPEDSVSGPEERCIACPPRRPGIAALEVVGINVVVNLFDRVFHPEPEQFHVTPATWWDNIQRSWTWDDNNFSTNQFAHPYHGSTYFNAARSNGLGYWESAPYAAMGSLMWEYMGETNPASLNDFFATTLGGIALGEMFHRLAVMIRDNRATGSARTWRELAALPLAPVATVNRFVRGEIKAVGPNPEDRTPSAFYLRLDGGYQRFTGDVFLGEAREGVFLELVLLYGDFFNDSAHAPFTVFGLQAETSTRDSGFISRFQGVGSLVRFPISAKNHRFFLTQRFDFISNSAFRTGGQSVEGRLVSRFGLSEKLRLHTSASVIGVLLGAVNSEFVGLPDRDYDFGPGVGVELSGVLTSTRGFSLGVSYLSEFLFTLAGDQGTHYVQMAGLNVLVPIWKGFGLGGRTGYFRRDSWYPGDVTRHQDSPEVRVYGWWGRL